MITTESLAGEVERVLNRRLDADVCVALESFVLRASQAWPGIVIPLSQLAAFLAPRLPDTATEISKLHGSDLYLVAACVHGSVEAQRVLCDRFLSAVPAFVRRVDKSAAFADEVRQELAAKLFVRNAGEEIRLSQYSGRGSLEGFLRVAATRAALNNKRRKRDGGDTLGEYLSGPMDDPERQLMKKRDAAVFRAAFERAVSALDVDERNVLRLHYVDGLSIEEVAATYRIGRATAARWLAAAKAKVVKSTLDEVVSSGRRGRRAREWLEIVESQLGSSLFECLRRSPR